ncbi:YaiI/YqxD family protein [Clostridium bornimense]|uniref:YaiI/YqxD family protein n=1 Tax=Clostridium bornimense TaxID=1216932 RepID=UPI001C1197D9|nr:YaiI/YqxD family protein [uncultured Clostridium sp.]MBU5317410.1 YaiI/YqxD family protein [Clostridium bornimense]
MKVLVDADACPVKNIIIDICSKKNIPVLLFVDTSHILSSPKCQVITVDKGRDSVDIALLNKTLKNDIVVTQDYGVAAMALGRGAHAINEKGLIYTNENIDMLLFQRHMGQKARRAGKRPSIIKKRTVEDDIKFKNNFLSLIDKYFNYV